MAKKKPPTPDSGDDVDLARAKLPEARDLPRPRRLFFDWSSGPGAQIEIVGAQAPYKINYTLQWRRAVRPPVQDLPLDNNGYQELCDRLAELKRLLNEGDNIHRSHRGEPSEKTGAALHESRTKTVGILSSLGRTLHDYILPDRMKESLVKDDLSDLFLEIGVDERLNEFPFELIFDGNEYFCLKHNVGRYVVSSHYDPPIPKLEEITELSVLLVSVPKTSAKPPHPGIQFRELPQVYAEAKEIESLLSPLLKKNFKHLSNATWDEFVKESHGDRKYKIVHFCGHAYFDKQDPAASGLAFQDKLVTKTQIYGRFMNLRPLFCFINACESVAAADEAERFNLYGLGQTFLELGVYLLGTRSLIEDEAAKAFARTFYSNLLVKNEPLGRAVRLARIASRDAVVNSFDWASYIFYGDPRFRFSND